MVQKILIKNLQFKSPSYVEMDILTNAEHTTQVIAKLYLCGTLWYFTEN